ncbi:hypothetical protein D3C86_2101040 [compost metagenome]
MYIPRTGCHAVGGRIDQRFDLFRSLRTAARQTADFTGDNSKTAALFTRTSSFHRCVQRQNVGLEGNAVDNAGDVADLRRSHFN